MKEIDGERPNGKRETKGRTRATATATKRQKEIEREIKSGIQINDVSYIFDESSAIKTLIPDYLLMANHEHELSSFKFNHLIFSFRFGAKVYALFAKGKLAPEYLQKERLREPSRAGRKQIPTTNIEIKKRTLKRK